MAIEVKRCIRFLERWAWSPDYSIKSDLVQMERVLDTLPKDSALALPRRAIFASQPYKTG